MQDSKAGRVTEPAEHRAVGATGMLYCGAGVAGHILRLKMALFGGNHASSRAEVEAHGWWWLASGVNFSPIVSVDFVETCACWHPALGVQIGVQTMFIYCTFGMSSPDNDSAHCFGFLCYDLSPDKLFKAVVIYLGWASDYMFHLGCLTFPCQ